MRTSYPHMCRDGHTQIGHNDSSHEICPLCRANNTIARLTRERDDALEMCGRWNRAIASGRTPSGSEYHNDPERCAEFLKYVSDTGHEAKKKLVYMTRERDAWKAEGELARKRGGGDSPYYWPLCKEAAAGPCNCDTCKLGRELLAARTHTDTIAKGGQP